MAKILSRRRHVHCTEASHFFEHMKLTATEKEIAKVVIKEISSRLSFMINVGIEYLTLDRVPTLFPVAKLSAYDWLHSSVPA
jgi:excinuclease UvrABC ATPase subunit